MRVRNYALHPITTYAASYAAIASNLRYRYTEKFRSNARFLHVYGRDVAIASHTLNSSNLSNKENVRSKGKVVHDFSDAPPDPSNLLSPKQQQREIIRLSEWIHSKKNIILITGAGLSTESGIPDYRGNDGAYRKGHKPMIHDHFIQSERSRKRYWARSAIGFRKFLTSKPNRGHFAIAELERRGIIGVDFACSDRQKKISVITQNVDGLHSKAGAKYVCDLHGKTEDLVCMKCGCGRCRRQFQEELEVLNSNWMREMGIIAEKKDDIRPDGDFFIDEKDFDDFVIPNCSNCQNGFFKPNVVFFGDCVPTERVKDCHAAIREADGLLCIGSSLEVYSAFRFVKAAAERKLPIAVLNVGVTRAEKEGLAVTKIEAPIGKTLEGCIKMIDLAN